MVAKLAKKLEIWKEAGLITLEQYQNIIQFEENEKSVNWAAYTIIALGGIIISMGIISLIAFNWDQINNTIKLLIDFILLAGIGAGFFYFYSKENEKAYTIFSLIYMLFTLATIGLIAQVYNTGGKWYQAIFFWGMITFPLAGIFTARAGVHIWFSLVISAIFTFLMEYLDKIYRGDESVLLLTVFIPTVLLILGFVSHRISRADLNYFKNALFQWSMLGFMGGSVTFQFYNLWTYNRYQNSVPSNELIIGGLIVLILVAIGLGFTQKTKLAIALATCLGIYTGNFLMIFNHPQNMIVNSLFFIAIWFSIAFLFLIIDYKRLFDFSIAVIGLRFLVLYFEVFKDLATTGFFLILSGLLIIGVALLYLKKKDSIAKWMRTFV